MDVATALQTRKSVRAFTQQPVEEAAIRTILDAARHAPSGTNMQPWEVLVVRGKKKSTLDTAMMQAFEAKTEQSMAYGYYPDEWREPFKGRRIACGIQMFDALDINRQDKERRLAQWASNYRAFDAPVVLFFVMDSSLNTGSYLDMGMFMQSLMLAAIAQGVSTCPQVALAEYSDVVKKELGISPDKVVIAGMAMGYEDSTAMINSYRTPREPVDSFTRFI